MADTEKRMLKIKTGSVVRLNKELGLYETEKEAEAKRVTKMRDEGADPYDIKHAVSVLEEAKIMIPDTRQRLEGALQDLTGYVANVEQKTGGLEELQAAKSAIHSAQAVLTC